MCLYELFEIEAMRNLNACLTGLIALLLVVALPARALTFDVHPGDDMVGQVHTVIVAPKQDFYTLARQYDVGFYELIEANPTVNPDAPRPGTAVILPSRYVLPNVAHQGIVVNVAEMRLYYFPKGTDEVITYPVGVGKQNWNTPLGQLHVMQKIKNPIWIVPESIRAYRAKRGDPVPKVMPAGPNNPLGDFALRLSNPRYLIHGTNEPDGVGQRSSAGCIRMYPENIAALFPVVPKGTPVHLINAPYKLGWHNGQLFFEAHVPFSEDQAQYRANGVWLEAMLKAFVGKDSVQINHKKAIRVARLETGLPVAIGIK